MELTNASTITHGIPNTWLKRQKPRTQERQENKVTLKSMSSRIWHCVLVNRPDFGKACCLYYQIKTTFTLKVGGARSSKMLLFTNQHRVMSYRTWNCISIVFRTKNPTELIPISTFILFKRTLFEILSLVGCSAMFWGNSSRWFKGL